MIEAPGQQQRGQRSLPSILNPSSRSSDKFTAGFSSRQTRHKAQQLRVTKTASAGIETAGLTYAGKAARRPPWFRTITGYPIEHDPEKSQTFRDRAPKSMRGPHDRFSLIASCSSGKQNA